MRYRKCRQCEISQHAFDRAKERLGWKKRTLKRLIQKIYRSPNVLKLAGGAFKKYLLQKRRLHPQTREVRVHGENLFFFAGNVLITVYRADNRFREHLRLLSA